MSIRQRIIQILRTQGVENPAQAIRNWQQSMGYQIRQNDDAQAIAGVVLDTVDYAGATGRRNRPGQSSDSLRAPIPTVTDRLMDTGDASAVSAVDATYQAIRNILRQHHIANPDAAIGIFMQSSGVQNFQGLDASEVAEAILGMQFPQRVAGLAAGPNATAAAEFGMSQEQYQLYLAAQLDRQQRQRLARQAAQIQQAQLSAVRQAQLAQARKAAQTQAVVASSSSTSTGAGRGGGGGSGGGAIAVSQQRSPAQKQFQQIIKRQRWADKLTLQKLKQYVTARKSTLQKLLQDVKKDENTLNKVVVAMSYNR